MCQLRDALSDRFYRSRQVTDDEIYGIVASDPDVPQEEISEILNFVDQLDYGNAMTRNPFSLIRQMYKRGID
jgi:hypothetical protein